MKNKIKVIIADAQMIIRIGLKKIISDADNIVCINEVCNAQELLNAINIEMPDVIILDYLQNGNFEVSILEKIKKKYPSIEFLIISSDNNKDGILKAIDCGAKGYLTKECDDEEIRNAVYATANGEKFLCHKVIDIIIEKHLHKDNDNCAAFNISSRESEIIKLTAKGWNAKTIADHLFLSTHTIYTHKKNIMKKLKLKSTSEMIVYAMQNNLIDEEELV
jgi:DNA-binding NarL/FixJ family response regulator